MATKAFILIETAVGEARAVTHGLKQLIEVKSVGEILMIIIMMSILL